ncbi:MAG: DUF2490 domain-containing protein [Methylococcaceae bacterium]
MFKKSITISSLMLSALLSATTVIAKTAEDFQTWGNITAIGSLDVINPDWKNYKYWLEGQGRFGNDTSQFSQGMVRTGLGYTLLDDDDDHLSLWLGYAWVPTDEPFTKTAFDEHRIWQQLLWTNKLPYGTLTSRARLEQRFLDTGDDVGWRYRHLLKISIPMPFAPGFSLVGSDEFFVNINDTDWGAADGFDQNRVFAGIGYDVNKNIKSELGYMNQYINKAYSPNLMDHILSVNLYLNY